MCQFDHQLTLKELLDYCSDPGNKCWECAWREFVNRYKKYIYDVLRYKSYGYKLPRLKKEFSEVINDLFDEVVILLCNHGCKALRDFRERENEIKFRAWLQVVCNRKADAYIRKNYVPMLIESEAGEVQNFLMGFEIDDRWQLYEEHVAFLRMNKKNKKQNIERERDQMKTGDPVLYYHSSCDEPGVVGIAEVVRESYPDHTSWDQKSKYFDPKSTPENPRWFMVDIKWKQAFKRLLSLQEMKEAPELQNMRVVQRGQRLSVQPVDKADFDRVVKMGMK